MTQKEMYTFIDTHAHLDGEEFSADREQVVARARVAGAAAVLVPAINAASEQSIAALCSAYPGFVWRMMGLHPEEVHDDWRDALEQLRPLLDVRPCVAVGEIGIDLYWDATFRDQQVEALDTQLHWCVDKGIPFIIHCREALDEILWVMDNFGEPLPQGVFHCFAGTPGDVDRVRKRGDFYFGVNGVVTFKKSTIPPLLPVIGLDRLLLETDAPYLAPVPHRGKRNESAFMAAVRDCVANCLGVAPDAVNAATEANAVRLFNLKLQAT